MTALVFLDTETVGLDIADDIWELAAVRRETSGTESTLHLFLHHDGCERLPESFAADHAARWEDDRALTWDQAAPAVAALFHDRPHIVGAVPDFDAYRIDRPLTARGFTQRWHHHLIDIENLAVGWLRAHGVHVPLPWDSDTLSRLVGVEAPGEGERHTAMGDVRWTMRVYDRLMAGASPMLEVMRDVLVDAGADACDHPEDCACSTGRAYRMLGGAT